MDSVSVVTYPKIGYGWMAADADAPALIEGVAFDPTLPTRREEYNFVADRLREERPGRALDAATGYVPDWHVVPYILSALGWTVDTIDLDARTFQMPSDPNVTRRLGLIEDLSAYGNEAFDAVLCISVLEHVDRTVQERFVAEAARVLRPGGLIIITADHIDPSILASLFLGTFDLGTLHPTMGSPLQPPVSYLLGRRL